MRTISGRSAAAAGRITAFWILDFGFWIGDKGKGAAAEDGVRTGDKSKGKGATANGVDLDLAGPIQNPKSKIQNGKNVCAQWNRPMPARRAHSRSASVSPTYHALA